MDIQQEISRAKAAAQALDTKNAIAILGVVIQKDPRNIDAWLTLAQVINDPEKKTQCLKRVLALDPNNIEAKLELKSLQQEAAIVALPEFDLAPEPVEEPEPDPPPPPPSPPVQQAPESATPTMPQKAASVEEDPFESPPKPARPPAKPKVAVRKEGQKKKPAKKQAKAAKKSDTGWGILEWSLIGIIVLILACTGIFYIGSRALRANEGAIAQPETTTDTNPTDVMIENIRASNAEDIDRYMATIHSNSPGYDFTKETIEEAFDTFDLSYRITRMAIVEQTGSRAEVEFTLTTRYIRGPSGFRDNTITGVMFLRTENGEWKIYNQEVENVDYLDQ